MSNKLWKERERKEMKEGKDKEKQQYIVSKLEKDIIM